MSSKRPELSAAEKFAFVLSGVFAGLAGVGDLMEFICLEGNEYGAAAGFVPGTGTSLK